MFRWRSTAFAVLTIIVVSAEIHWTLVVGEKLEKYNVRFRKIRRFRITFTTPVTGLARGVSTVGLLSLCFFLYISTHGDNYFHFSARGFLGNRLRLSYTYDGRDYVGVELFTSRCTPPPERRCESETFDKPRDIR